MIRRKICTFTAGVFFLAAALSCAGSDKVLAKSVAALQEKLPGVYPDPYYVINDPSYNSDVVKIAVLRPSVNTGVDNPYSPLPPICGILPLPTWNNGAFVYNTDGRHQSVRTDIPLDMLNSRTFTLVVENPQDTSDYDIVVKETYSKNSAGSESQHMFTCLYFHHKKLIPSIRMEVASPVVDIKFSCDTGPLKKEQLSLLLFFPIKNVDTEKTARLRFMEKLYQEITLKLKEPTRAIRDRKRHYIFRKDPSLKKLEEKLLACIESSNESYKEKLVQYKERMDYIEHIRCLAEIRDISQTTTAKYGNRLIPATSLLDVTYGRNFNLYHPEIRTAMIEKFDVRQQTISELVTLREHFSSYLDPISLQGLEAQGMSHYKRYFNLQALVLSAVQ